MTRWGREVERGPRAENAALRAVDAGAITEANAALAHSRTDLFPVGDAANRDATESQQDREGSRKDEGGRMKG